MPVGFDFIRVLKTPAFTKETLLRLTGNLGSSLMKVFRESTKHFKTESWRKVNLPCDYTWLSPVKLKMVDKNMAGFEGCTLQCDAKSFGSWILNLTLHVFVTPVW